MICIIRGLKCCTDRLMRTINCLGVPVSTGLIIAKAYNVPKIDELEWGYIMAPSTSLVVLNLTYYACCRTLLQKKKINEVELTPV